jgi:hypothetical protein
MFALCLLVTLVERRGASMTTNEPKGSSAADPEPETVSPRP